MGGRGGSFVVGGVIRGEHAARPKLGDQVGDPLLGGSELLGLGLDKLDRDDGLRPRSSGRISFDRHRVRLALRDARSARDRDYPTAFDRRLS
jgi:hypothetical protein